MGTKKGRIYDKGAPFKGAPQRFRRAVAPNCPPPLQSATENMVMTRKIQKIPVKRHFNNYIATLQVTNTSSKDGY